MRRPPANKLLWLVALAVASAACGEGLLFGGIQHDDEAPAPDSQPPAPDARPPAVDQSPAPDAAPAPPLPDAAPAPTRLGIGGIVGGSYNVSQPYGPTTFWMDYSYCRSYGHWPAGQNVHCAVDISIARGTRLFAPARGKVTTAGGTPWYKDDLNPAAGDLRVELEDGTEVVFGHMATIDVSIGRTVEPGTPLGKSGSAGTGAHLHLEVRVRAPGCAAHERHTVDPLEYFGR